MTDTHSGIVLGVLFCCRKSVHTCSSSHGNDVSVPALQFQNSQPQSPWRAQWDAWV